MIQFDICAKDPQELVRCDLPVADMPLITRAVSFVDLLLSIVMKSNSAQDILLRVMASNARSDHVMMPTAHYYSV